MHKPRHKTNHHNAKGWLTLMMHRTTTTTMETRIAAIGRNHGLVSIVRIVRTTATATTPSTVVAPITEVEAIKTRGISISNLSLTIQDDQRMMTCGDGLFCLDDGGVWGYWVHHAASGNGWGMDGTFDSCRIRLRQCLWHSGLIPNHFEGFGGCCGRCPLLYS